MPKTFTIILLLFSFYTGFAQKKFDKIRLVSSLYTPVSEVVVQDVQSHFMTVPDINGILLLQNFPRTVNTVTISGLGYEQVILQLDSVRSPDGIATVVLKQKDVALADVVVTAHGRNAAKTFSALDIYLRPVTSTQQVLRIVPGLFIGQHAGGGKAEQIFLRGFDLDHGTDINISVDGMPVNMVSHAHGQGYADLHFVIPELVEKVDFQKGSYTAERGNFTTAGYVAFETKKFLDKNFIKVEGGQFGTFRSVGGFNLLKPSLTGSSRNLYVAGEFSSARGYFENPQKLRRYNAVLKYGAPFGKNGTFTALATAFKSSWNASGQIPEREVENGRIGFYGAIDPTEGGQTARYNASFEVKNKAGLKGVLKNQVYFTRYHFDLFSNFTFFKEDPVNGDRIRQKEKRNIYGYNGSYQKEYFLGSRAAEATAGVQLRYDAITNNELSRVKDRNTLLSRIQYGDINEGNAAAFVSQKLFLTKNLRLTTGLRYDYFSNRYQDHLLNTHTGENASLFSPKLNFDYFPSRNVQLYLYNGRGFHSNDTRVVVAQKSKRTLPPAYSSDLGGLFKPSKNLLVQVAFWRLWLDQEFIYVGDEGIVEAGGKSKRIGGDVSVRYEVIKNLFVHVDMNYASSKLADAPKAENSIPLSPRFTGVGGIVLKKKEGFNGSLFYRHMDRRPAVEDYSIVAEGYGIVDAAVNYTKQKWEAGISVQNLLNRRWKETQFATESRLQNEPEPVTEIHFTPGNPFFARFHLTCFFW